MKSKILNELNLKDNLCFNQMRQINNTIHITKSKIQVSSTREIKEICTIQMALEKYKKYADITISLDEVIIELKLKTREH